MPVDPGEHIPLIYRVMGQMSIPNAYYDEAFSIGQVAITEAACKYDPSKNVPVANWLGQNIRWSLQSWRRSLRQREDVEIYIRPAASETATRTVADHSIPEEYVGSLTQDKAPMESHVALKELIQAIRELPALQRKVIIGSIQGYSGVEMAKMFGVTTVAISRARKRAQATLREVVN